MILKDINRETHQQRLKDLIDYRYPRLYTPIYGHWLPLGRVFGALDANIRLRMTRPWKPHLHDESREESSTTPRSPRPLASSAGQLGPARVWRCVVWRAAGWAKVQDLAQP